MSKELNICMQLLTSKQAMLAMCYSNCNGMYCIVHHDMYNSTVYHMRCRSSHKCSVLHVENKNNNSVYHLWSPYVIGRPYIFLPCSSYNVNNVQLIDNTATVDLGVIIDGKLRFDHHIANIVSKGHSRAALIRRCFKPRDSCLLFRAFTVFVRPLLEYCSPVWNPHYHCDIEKIESVQRRFTKLVDFKMYRINVSFVAIECRNFRTKTVKK